MLDSWQMKQNQCPKLVSSFVWQFFKFLRGFLWFLDDPFCSGINVFLYGLDVRTLAEVRFLGLACVLLQPAAIGQILMTGTPSLFCTPLGFEVAGVPEKRHFF